MSEFSRAAAALKATAVQLRQSSDALSVSASTSIVLRLGTADRWEELPDAVGGRYSFQIGDDVLYGRGVGRISLPVNDKTDQRAMLSLTIVEDHASKWPETTDGMQVNLTLVDDHHRLMHLFTRCKFRH